MENISTTSLQTWAGITALVSVLISLAKAYVPWVINKERYVAVALGIVLAAASKLLHIGFQDTAWVPLILAGISAGPASGVVYKHLTKPNDPPPAPVESDGIPKIRS